MQIPGVSPLAYASRRPTPKAPAKPLVPIFFQGINDEDRLPAPLFQRVQHLLAASSPFTRMFSEACPIPETVKARHLKLMETLPIDADAGSRLAYQQELISDYHMQRAQGKSNDEIVAGYTRWIQLSDATDRQRSKLDQLGSAATLKMLYESDQQEINDCVNTLLLPRLPATLRQIQHIGKTFPEPEITPMVLVEALDLFSGSLLYNNPSSPSGTFLLKANGDVFEGDTLIRSASETHHLMAEALPVSSEALVNLLSWIVKAAPYNARLLGGFQAQQAPNGNVQLSPDPETEPHVMPLRTRWTLDDAD